MADMTQHAGPPAGPDNGIEPGFTSIPIRARDQIGELAFYLEQVRKNLLTVNDLTGNSRTVPGVLLGARVGSWFRVRNAAPRSTALMSTCVCPRISRSWLNPCCPTYETSMVDAHGSVIWTPACHCVEDGMSASYGHTDVNWGGPRISRPEASSCSSAYRTVREVENPGFPTCEYMVSPAGRSWNNPIPPRTTIRCVPLTS